MSKKAKKQKLNEGAQRSLSDIIISDDIDEFKKLVHEKGIKNINDSHTKYPAHFACERNAVKILNYLINHKFVSPLELDDNDKTFIHSAALAGNNEVLSLILSSNTGIYLESTNKKGETAFYGAVKYGHLAAAKTLISGGANINPRNWQENGATPLCLAAQNNNLDMIQLLLDSGAKIECGTFDKITPLCFAAQNGNLEAVQFLHSKGGVLNHKSTFGDSPLSLASRNGHAEVVDYCLNTNSLSKIHIKNAIYEAVSKGHIEPLTLLLKHYSIQNDSPLLYIAVENRNHDIVDLLLEHNIDVNFSSRSSDTALHIAAQNNDIVIAQKLIKHGALLNSRNLEWTTPLHEAVKKGHIEFAELLLSHGTNPDISFKDGTTPLHTAIMTKNGDMVLLLLQYNAKLNAKTSAECPNPNATVMDIAKKYGSEAIIKILNAAFELDRKQQNSIDDEITSTPNLLMISEDNTTNDSYYLGLPNSQLFDENNYLL